MKESVLDRQNGGGTRGGFGGAVLAPVPVVDDGAPTAAAVGGCVTSEVGGCVTAADYDDNLTNADSDKPSKSRRKVAEMIDDINVALGLKKGREVDLLIFRPRPFNLGFQICH